jgi:hemolysin III
MACAPSKVPAPPASRPRLRLAISEPAANWLTHGLGLVLALIGAPLLVALALRVAGGAQVAACTVYGATLILLYASSTHYHVRQYRPGDDWRLMADHICIYLLIAGTYTPFCLTTLRGTWGWGLFTAIWALAATGIAFKLVWGMRFPRVSLALYLVMGWLAAISIAPLIRHASTAMLLLLLAGGLAYTAGTLFYARVWIGRVPYAHAVWHLAVVAGSALHYFAVRESLLSLTTGTPQ